ncbi:MAG: RNA polymerase sigma factor, partial [bacterium]|nr:RNA polymerase sigma factor [bacterium]
MEILLRRHYPRVYAVCRRLAGNDADAADAAQEALIAISRGLKRFDARSSFTTWSYRVATNTCLDEVRSSQRTTANEPTD